MLFTYIPVPPRGEHTIDLSPISTLGTWLLHGWFKIRSILRFPDGPVFPSDHFPLLTRSRSLPEHLKFTRVRASKIKGHLSWKKENIQEFLSKTELLTSYSMKNGKKSIMESVTPST